MAEPSDDELQEQLKQAQKAKEAAKGIERAGKGKIVKAALERKTGKGSKNGK